MSKSNVLRRIALLLLLLAGGWYVSRHWQDLAELRQFRRSYLTPLLAVHLGALGLNGWTNRVLIARFGLRLSFVHWYGLAAVNALGNYLPLPQAGAAMRGAYLKRLHRFDYPRYAATVLFAYVLALALTGAAGLGALAWMRSQGARVSWVGWAVCAGLCSLGVLVAPQAAAVAARVLPGGGRLARLAEGYGALARGGVIPKLVAARVALMALNAAGVWLGYQSIGRAVGWGPAIVVSLGTVASGVVNVTPGNAGTAEAAAWGAAAVVGEHGETAVNAALIGRITAALVVFTVGPLSVAVLRRRSGAEGKGEQAEAVAAEGGRTG